MIRTGWLPPLSRPISRRRTLPYTRRRRVRRPKAGVAPATVDTGDMLFDQPAELPVATLRPKDTRTQLGADLRAWLAARWRWFKPRTIPMIVAFVGMLAVIGSASWLRNYARAMPERLTPAPSKIVVKVGPPEATITIDGQVAPAVELQPLAAGCATSQIRVEPVLPATE